MDPWKPIRLWLCIGAILAFLVVGTYARLRWGVPEHPYGSRHYPLPGELGVAGAIGRIYRTINPVRQIRIESGATTWDDFRH